MKFRRARRAALLLLLLAGLLGVTTVARAQFQTHSSAATAGGACTTGDFAFPDPSGYALKCIASVWTIVNQPAAAAGSTGYVQFDNSGVLGASSNLFWDNTLFRLGIGTTSPVASLDLSQRTDALALPVGTQGQEPASPINGMIRYSTTANDVEAYIAGAWTTLTTGGSNASIFLGTAKGTTDPSVNGDSTTGFYTAGSHLVDVSANNTQIMEWSTSGANIVNGSLLMNGANGLSYPPTDSTAGASIAIGVGALTQEPSLASTAFGNTSIGYQSMNSASMTTAAVLNTAVGYQALKVDTSGSNNVALGHRTLLANTTGGSNTALGYQSSLRNISGSSITSVGWQALANFTATGTAANTAVGVDALQGVNGSSTGINNTALGYQAGNVVTTGSSNTIFGYGVASTTLATGSNNILIGTGSAVDTPAQGTSNFLNIGNLIYGTSIGTAASPGNVGIGTTNPTFPLDVYGAGYGLKVGTTSTYVETSSNGIASVGAALQINNSNNQNLFIGSGATTKVGIGTASAANRLDINGAASVGYPNITAPTNGMIVQGSVGIGSSSPVVSLDLSQKTDALALPVGTQGQEPASPLNGMIRYSTTANDVEAYVSGAWTTLTTGGAAAQITLGTSATTPDPASSFSATTGEFSPTSGAYAVSSAGTEVMRVNGTGVGIGTNAPAYLLHVGSPTAVGVVADFQNSSGYCTFSPSANGILTTCTSDVRLKKDIVDAGDALAWLGTMRIRDFTLKATGERRTGVIAQEMIKVHPEMVRMGATGFYQVDVPDAWKLIKAIQELKTENDDLVTRISAEDDALKAANDNIAELRAEVADLRRELRAQ